VPLHEATIGKAKVLACARCRGVHFTLDTLPAISFRSSTDDEEPTLRPPPLFECAICKRTFSLDQGDGVTCRACAPSPSIGADEGPVHQRIARIIGLQSLLDRLF
jgi:hypothetical protein